MSSAPGATLTLTCPSCQKMLRLPATAAGKSGRCPVCKNVFQIPASAPAPAPAAADDDSDTFDFADEKAPPASAADFAYPTLNAPAATATKPRASDAQSQRGAFDMEKKGIEKGVLGGIAMIVIAIVVFVVAWICGYFIPYTVILLIIGIYAVVKGLATGNIAGRSDDG